MKIPERPPQRDIEDISNLIFDLFGNNETNKTLSDIDNEDYPYWDKFKYKVANIPVEPSVLWFYNKLLRTKSQTEIKISQNSGFTFKLSNTNKISYLLHLFDMNLGGFLEGSSAIPPEDKNRFLISSIMEEAIASSQLEGAVTTREMAKEMLKTERKPRNTSERMILNNYLTIKKIIELRGQTLTKELIKEIHGIISKNTLDNKEKEGNWRINNEVNVVDSVSGEIVYTPPDHNHLERLMDDFCAFANKENNKDGFIHPIVKGIILHFLIGYIHPFADGNGRTARAIFYWYVISKGYWLVEYLSISRIIVKSPTKYAQAYLYTEYDDNDLTYFINYNLRAINLSMESLQLYIKRKIQEKKSAYSLIKSENVNQRQATILSDLFNFPDKTLSIKEIQNLFGTSYQTARTDLMGLARLGYLEEKIMGKKIVYFQSNNFHQNLQGLGDRNK